jgi:L-malate glycosyltransferase
LRYAAAREGPLLKILHVSSARGFGGGERHLADLAGGLVARGHEVHVAVAPEAPLARRLPAVPPERRVPVRIRAAVDLVAAVRLARAVRRRAIDIVHAHLARDYPVAVLAARAGRRAQVVLTRHVLFPLGRVHRLTFPRVARVIAVSGAVAVRLRAQRLVPDDRIVCIPNGIDVDAAAAWATRRAAGSADGPTVGTLGDLGPVKGHDDFLRAAARVAARMPGARFRIAGGERSPRGVERRRLERLAGELGLAGRLELVAPVEDPAGFLAGLDVFVSAARSEAFGLAILEALAVGVPVVATRTDGAREVLDEGAAGRLVEIGDVEALAAAIGELLGDPAARAGLVERGTRRARERFSLAAMVEATERVYREALAGPAGPAGGVPSSRD